VNRIHSALSAGFNLTEHADRSARYLPLLEQFLLEQRVFQKN
jgi:hypothetical protein